MEVETKPGVSIIEKSHTSNMATFFPMHCLLPCPKGIQ